METQKAGCYLIDKKRRQIALVYREKQRDYSFPKGHLEKGESLLECAIRETEEEVKRIPLIDNNFEPIAERYETPSGEKCVCYMYLAEDGGESNNNSSDTHPVVWVDFDKVEEVLSYKNLKDSWKIVRKYLKI